MKQLYVKIITNNVIPFLAMHGPYTGGVATNNVIEAVNSGFTVGIVIEGTTDLLYIKKEDVKNLAVVIEKAGYKVLDNGKLRAIITMSVKKEEKKIEPKTEEVKTPVVPEEPIEEEKVTDEKIEAVDEEQKEEKQIKTTESSEAQGPKNNNQKNNNRNNKR